MDDHTPGSFLGLPAELLLTVIEHCDTRSLAALSGVTKEHNNICRPIIFRKVDLSTHNRGTVRCTFPTALQFLDTSWPEPSDSLKCNNIPPIMHKRQEAFLSALIRTPSLGEHVQSFSWTLLLLDSNRRTDSNIDPFAINQSVVLPPESPFNQIWDVFASLKNVRKLDLAWLSRHHAMPLIHGIPPVLFPAATSVRLAGVMPYTLAASILLVKPQNLLHLDLDNLQQSGIIPSTHIDVVSAETNDRHQAKSSSNAPRTETPRPTPTPTPGPALPHRQTRQPWNKPGPFETDGAYFNAPGPMQNLLGALAGKCTALTSLHLRKPGARDRFDFCRPACRRKEADICAEWAVFLASVRPTLECLVFEQGERCSPRTDQAQPRVRPMDQLFGDAIFPTLAAEGAWPRMEKVTVRGVQEWKVDDGTGAGEMVHMDGRAELKAALGNGVEVVVSRRAREADHLGMGYV